MFYATPNLFTEIAMKFLFTLATACLLLSSAVNAEVLKGTYRTEPNDEGAYLQVKFGACYSNKELTCGTIKGSYLKNGAKNKNSKIVGEYIVWDMVDEGQGKFASGKIWDPSDPKDDGSKKIYKSKMELKGNTLSVSGCILWICKAQDWKKVN